MDREEMKEIILEIVLVEAMIVNPITSLAIVAVIRNDLCLHVAVRLPHQLVKGPEVLGGPVHEVDPEVHPVAEPELLPVTMYRCQKCRSISLKVVYLI